MNTEGVKCSKCLKTVYPDDHFTDAQKNNYCIACARPQEIFKDTPLYLREQILFIIEVAEGPTEVVEEPQKQQDPVDEQAQYYADWEGFF
jgi:NAD-dependent SIR2 family protein deacetylase